MSLTSVLELESAAAWEAKDKRQKTQQSDTFGGHGAKGSTPWHVSGQELASGTEEGREGGGAEAALCG